jgi:hypothetical protein
LNQTINRLNKKNKIKIKLLHNKNKLNKRKQNNKKNTNHLMDNNNKSMIINYNRKWYNFNKWWAKWCLLKYNLQPWKIKIEKLKHNNYLAKCLKILSMINDI